MTAGLTLTSRLTRWEQVGNLAVTLFLAFALSSPHAFAQTPTTPPAAPVGLYKVAGSVVNSITGSALAQARVALVDTKSRKNFATLTTSEDGHFEFLSIPAGKYSLQAARRGFIAASYEQHEQFSTAIVTGPELKTDSLLLRLTPMALISGHITNNFGEPVHRAQVTLFQQDLRGGMNRITHTLSATTDDRGYYDFSLLGPGTYFVSVTATPWYAVNSTSANQVFAGGTATVSPALDVAYPTTYYGGATEAESASPIALKGGDHTQIDIQLNAVPALHILFHVAKEENTPFQPPTLEKHVFDSVEGLQQRSVVSVEPGVYELVGVPPGHYTVRMNNSDSGEPGQSSEVNLTREGQEIDGLRGEPLASLKVTVKLLGEEKLPKQLFLALDDQRQRAVAFGPVDASGQAKFDGLAPGKYAIVCYSQRKRYAVTRISSAALETSGHDVIVTPGSSQDLTLSIAAGVVTVEGVVHKAGKPVAGVMVVLIPKDPESHIEFFRRDQSDLDGTFSVASVIPGLYTIVAVEDAWGFEWLQPGVLSRYAQHGQQLNIGPLMQGSVLLPNPVEVQPR
jgi:hypothetical protein